MTDDLASVKPAGPVFRLGRGKDPWEWPDWSYAKPDGTFGNRWDDPQGLYRVLYACSQRLGTFVETLARFRPDPHVVAGLSAIAGDAGNALRPGEVPKSWLSNRRIGEATFDGDCVAVGHSSSLAWFAVEMVDRLAEYSIAELDAAAIRLSLPRAFTQEVSRRVFEITAGGRRRYAGIAYLSRLGDEFENWAIFEPAVLEPKLAENLAETDAVDRDLPHESARYAWRTFWVSKIGSASVPRCMCRCRSESTQAWRGLPESRLDVADDEDLAQRPDRPVA